MEYVFFKKAVIAYRAYLNGIRVEGSQIDRKTFIERWRDIQRMTGLWRVRK